jgi:hypothetical protein
LFLPIRHLLVLAGHLSRSRLASSRLVQAACFQQSSSSERYDWLSCGMAD